MPAGQVKTSSEIMQEFLAGLFGEIPADSVIEIRHKRNSDKGAKSDWLTSINQVRAIDYGVDEHVWFGAALRAKDMQDGSQTGLTWAPAIWADFDKVEDKDGLIKRLVQQVQVPAPTYIVDSGGGIHAYWRLDKMLDMRNPLQVESLRSLVYGLACTLHSDSTVHDPTRVLGLPGTSNVGNGKTKVYDPPREVHVVFSDPRNVYGMADLARYRRPLPDRGQAVAVAAAAGAVGLAPSDLRIPPRLQKLVDSGWVDGCGYAGRSELDQGVMVAMLNGEHTDEEIYSVFKNNVWGVGAKYRDKGADGDRYLELTLKNSKRWTTKNTHAPSPVGTVREIDGHMEVRHAKDWTIVCNRTLQATAKLVGDSGGYRLRVSGDIEDGAQVTAQPSSFASNTAFKTLVNTTGAAWLGSDLDVQRLLPYFEGQKPPVMHSVSKIGWHGDRVVFPNAQLINGKLEENSDYLYLGKLTGARLVEGGDWEELAGQVADLVPRLHTAGAMLPILGWFAATFAAPMVRKYSGGSFPLLMVFGTPEAGKTTILELMQRLAGRNSTLLSSTLTLFANIETLSGSNSLPVVLDEHRANNTGRYRTHLYPVLREAYNGGIMSRGKQDLSVARYELSAPIAIGGETPFRDPALVDRTVHVKLERSDKDPGALAALLSLPLEEFAVGMYRRVKEVANIELWERSGVLLPGGLRRINHERQRLAWQTVAFGLLALDPDGAPAAIAQFEDFRAVPEEDVVKPTVAVVHEAVRVMAELMKAHRMRDMLEFQIRDGVLWFIPSLVLPLIEEYFQRIDTDLPMGRESILGRMKEDVKEEGSIVVEYQKTFRMGTRTARGIALSLGAIEAQLGVPVSYWTQMAVEVKL